MTPITIVGIAAAVLTTTSFIPQALKTIKTKNTKDLSLPMYIILNMGIILWLIYGLFIQNIPVILANSVTLVFSLIILVYKLRFK